MIALRLIRASKSRPSGTWLADAWPEWDAADDGTYDVGELL